MMQMQEGLFRTNITPKEAVALQKKLALKIRVNPLEKKVRIIAGADVSMERFGDELYAGIVLMTYPELEPFEIAFARVYASFPYVPGLLSFREIPGLLECVSKLKKKPDLIVVDGQGIAHPRRMGIASHLGLVTGIPTIGCAKSRLYGEYEIPQSPGDAEKITDSQTGEHIGFALLSKKNSNPLIISPGHGIDVWGALEIVRNCLRGYRLPEPTRRAHEEVNGFRKKNLL